MYFFYFFPLGLGRPTRRRPLLTWAFMATLVVVFAWQRWLAPATGQDPLDFVFFPGNGRPWTVVTAIFLHGSWIHLLGNLLYLHVLGPPLEDRLGRVALAGLALVLGVGDQAAAGDVAGAVVQQRDDIGARLDDHRGHAHAVVAGEALHQLVLEPGLLTLVEEVVARVVAEQDVELAALAQVPQVALDAGVGDGRGRRGKVGSRQGRPLTATGAAHKAAEHRGCGHGAEPREVVSRWEHAPIVGQRGTAGNGVREAGNDRLPGKLLAAGGRKTDNGPLLDTTASP